MSKQLVKKDESGKTTFAVPTTGQVTQIIDRSADTIKTLQDMLTFADGLKDKHPELRTIPVTQDAIDKFNHDLETVKKLPYA